MTTIAVRGAVLLASLLPVVDLIRMRRHVQARIRAGASSAFPSGFAPAGAAGAARRALTAGGGLVRQVSTGQVDRRAAGAMGVAVIVVSASAWPAGGPGLVALAALGLLSGVAAVVIRGRGQQGRLVDADLPALLESLAGSVRSGASLVVAVREAARAARGPLAVDLRAVVASVDGGQSLTSSLQAWADTRRSDRVRLAVAALTLALQCGGAEARTLDGVAATLRDRVAVERELVALSSQARSSAVVMIAAPASFVLLTGLGDPSLWGFLLGTKLGFACLAGGLVLDAGGGAWMWSMAKARA